jgi:drug/metabolite transporter (DMT)-like permease
MPPDWFWIAFTLIAALAQTARNAMQRGLTAQIGTVGAAHVRFLYGFPFAGLFLAGTIALTGLWPAWPGRTFLCWITLGGGAQIGATVLLLAAMRTRSFVAAVAYTKSEPVLVLIGGLVMLHETPGLWQVGAICIATAGVTLMSWPPHLQAGREWYGPVAYGLTSGALFAVSAVAYRGGILTVESGSFLVDAGTTLTAALGLQAVALSLYLLVTDRKALIHLLRTPRQSSPAGFFGALASQFWFMAFALQSASLVRTLALAEVLMAQIVTRRLFKQASSGREKLGMAALVIGVAGVLLAGG